MSFEKTCRPCSGSGYYGLNQRAGCRVCGGSGVNVLEGSREEYRTCRRCSGSGYYGLNQRATCQSCRGLGILRRGQTTAVTAETTATLERYLERKKSETEGAKYDLFISHASEDKEFVTPLAKALVGCGLRVWYDKFVLKAGDSLRREIDKGLARSSYGIVVLSHSYFSKHIPQTELDGLAARERLNKKVIIPIWHQITKDEVEACSPILSDRWAIKSDQPTERIVQKIIEAIS